MIEFLPLAAACAAGLLLGAGFFGGLWWTVRRGVSSERPALWFVGSLVLRMSIVLVGFHLVSGGEWKRLLACLLGFAIARFAVTSLAGTAHGRHDLPAETTTHAP
ncbi:MAG TPA: ATP synthase subunit I [Terrimesophilobacter sp.]|nr:ATP synthase subunit I [Terrimesophilobacter sp.]